MLLGFDGAVKLCDLGIANSSETGQFKTHIGHDVYLAVSPSLHNSVAWAALGRFWVLLA